MNQSYTIKEAILSEKTYKQMESGVYTFLVRQHSTKAQVAKAVEKQFGVKVAKVNLAIKAAKTKRIMGTRKMTKTSNGRKAIVYLVGGQSIEMLAPKKDKTKAKKKESEKPKESKQKNENKGLLSKITRSQDKRSQDAD